MAKVKDLEELVVINPWSELVEIPNDAISFKSPTSGKTYFINREVNELSLKRYETLEKMLVELQFSMTNETFMTTLQAQAKAINDNNHVMTSVLNYNMMTGIADLNTKHVITYWISTLYIAREGEDVTQWSETIAKEKIEDWMSFAKTGFFLNLRNTMFGRLMQLSERIFQDFSEFPLNRDFLASRTEGVNQKYK
jgi:hypothetical protein